MLKKYFLLLAVGALWGSQFIFMSAAIDGLPPVWVGTIRATAGFLTLWMACRMLGIKGTQGRWLDYSLVGVLEATIPFVLVAWGQQFLDTAVASILMGTIPFFTIILSPVMVRGAKITFAGLCSVVMGFVGLIVLFYPELASGSESTNMLGAVAIVVAACSFAMALLMLKRISSAGHPLMTARNVLGAASVQMLIVAMIMDPINTLHPTTSSLLSVLYLGVMCGGLVYCLYMILIRNAGPVFASFSNYLVPVIGVLLGATINHEDLPSNTWIALGIILMALATNELLQRLSHKTDGGLVLKNKLKTI
ncbi:putative inner membrane transporter YedA [invertebrate metagenome]|uniref:Putative inner membrane transporter YedA n=1 Tax=invertebrate metagenome TaxID=1711999 RepID=A0A2H9TAD0_9ZZZZ